MSHTVPRRLLCSKGSPGMHTRVHNAFRGFQSSSLLAGDIKIEVPSMGDSISEGTVASVAKQAGQWSSSYTTDAEM